MVMPKELTQEDRDRIEAEVREMRDRVMRGESKFDQVDKPKRVAKKPGPKPRSTQTTVRGGGNAARRLTTQEQEEITYRYTEQDESTGTIAKALEINVKTVVKYLKAEGVWVRSNGGRPMNKVCGRGHDQAEWRRGDEKTGWYCGKCALERNAGYKQAERERKKDNRLEPLGSGRWQVWIEGKLYGQITGDEETIERLDTKLRKLSATRGKNHD